MFLNSPPRSALRPSATALLALSSLLLGACGNDLADGDFGGVDLLPFFHDSESNSPPVSYKKTKGFLDGRAVEFFDFGWSASLKDTPDEDRRKLLGLEPGDRIPKVAPVNPMYFFFDNKGNPMFSAPVREKKTGAFFMRGGPNVKDPNPSAKAVKNVAYLVRERDALNDPLRNTADYQRPIIDVILDRGKDEALQEYSGLWEFVQVTAPAGYQPDDIKSWATLEKGVIANDFKLKFSSVSPSGDTELLAINCPIVDSRSLVQPNISVYDAQETQVPQPRVELWYRRKRIDCFLVNGWETLGRTKLSATGESTYELFKASEEKSRIGVLDADVAVLGTGLAQKRRLVSPLSQMYIPRLSARDENFYVDENFVTTGALPRRQKSDLPGYRPVRWLWNIAVSEDGYPFSGDTLKEGRMTDVRTIDDSKLSPREGITRNFPLTSAVLDCTGATPDQDPCSKLGLACGPPLSDRTRRCELPVVRYGETCGPSIANCRANTDKDDLVEKWFVVDGTGSRAALMEAGVSPDWLDEQERLIALGTMTKRIIDRGDAVYSCLADPVSEIGSCYLSCDGSKANAYQNSFTEPEKIRLIDGNEIEVKWPLDSRCGGRLMPGFRCLPVTDASTDGGGQYCLRDCTPGSGDTVGRAVCGRPTPGYFSDATVGKDISKNTSCLSVNKMNADDPTIIDTTFSACVLDQAFSPFAP